MNNTVYLNFQEEGKLMSAELSDLLEDA